MKRIDSIERPRVPDSPDLLPPGLYWVGDPCYARTHSAEDTSVWLQLCDDMPDERGAFVAAAYNAPRLDWLAASSTAYGDGTYTGSDGNEYPVDAGLIGVVPEFFWGRHHNTEGMYLVDFTEPFGISFDADTGVITIGHITIPTGWEEDEDEDEDECERCGSTDSSVEYSDTGYCWRCEETIEEEL